MPPKKSNENKNGSGGTLGIENELWEAADKLRGHLDAAGYKSVVLGLIFLKYISDMFEQVRERVEQEGLDDPEDRDVYLAERVFRVPKAARWKNLQDNAKQDMLGRVYEYFLSQFASQEGRKGGEFYTPRSVVRVLVEMLAPYKGRVFDPCCGSGGMFVQSEKFVEA